MNTTVLFEARARVLHDLDARGLAGAAAVSALEDAMTERGWWVEQWPEGKAYVAGLVAQDVQDAAFDAGLRWPVCEHCRDAPEHSLHIQPDLGGPDPMWVCEESGRAVAGLGRLSAPGRAGPAS
jgi:hypothetical protein